LDSFLDPLKVVVEKHMNELIHQTDTETLKGHFFLYIVIKNSRELSENSWHSTILG
jgi:hypothetical protein